MGIPYNNTDSQKMQNFLSLYVKSQKRIYGYILSVVSNWSDTEDIMQETTSLMWQKFDDFQEGTNFSGWGIQIAKYKIREFRRKSRKLSELSEQVLNTLASRAETYYSEPDVQLTALEKCIKKLKTEDMALIQMRYEDGATIKDMALRLGRPIQGLYKVMARIHASLVICVRRSLAMEGFK
jgi:RNA polymerase sigma-70 factor (ECF subfamily)